MAAVGMLGETSGGVVGVMGQSNLRFAAVVSDLLPFGLAWDREDPVLQEIIRAESRELSRADIRGRDLTRELDPSRTFELLVDWEEAYGLPECAQPDTIEGRRAALVAKLLAEAGHDQSWIYWLSIFKAFGYSLKFVDLGPEIFTCIDECTDPMGDEGFSWLLATFSGGKDALLECFIGHNAPIWSFPILHFLWQPPTSVPAVGDLYAIAGSQKGYLAAGGAGGATMWSDDGGATWNAGPVLGGTIDALCEVEGAIFGVSSFVGMNGLVSTDGGQSWGSYGFIPDALYAICRAPSGVERVVAVGAGGSMYETDFSGILWFPLASPTVQPLYGVAQGEDQIMIAVGAAGTVCRSTDAGATWSLLPAITWQDLGAVAGFGTTFIAVSSGGAIFRSGDSGLSWDAITPLTTEVLRGVTGSWTGRWTACGDSGTILSSLDDGLTWELQQSPTTSTLRAATVHYPGGRAVLAGLNSTIVLE